jgi:hypothetical protein
MSVVMKTSQQPANGATNWQRLSEIYIQPKERYPSVYVPPTLGAMAFISNIAVTIDGVPIDDIHGFSDNHFMYNHLNRVFTTDGVRREKYCTSMDWPSNSEERAYSPEEDEVPADPTAVPPTDKVDRKPPKMSKKMERIMDAVTFDDRETSEPMVFSGSIDGIFPFSTQVI